MNKAALAPVAAKWAGRAALAVSGILMTLVMVMVAAHIVALFQDLHRFPHIQKALRVEAQFERPFVAVVRATLPSRIAGRDITTFLAGVLIYLLSMGFKRLSTRLSVLSAKLADDLLPKEQDREKLLEIYAQAKTKLEGMKRPLAFLSMDVVDSTGLKKGEDPSVAERDFRQYKKFVEKALESNGALKATWTPDGVMACFSDAASAMRAARDTINGLHAFNSTVKTMRGEFKVRAGVNAGPVLYDETTPLEEMSDRVIDVAGHMQKYGSPNCVSVPAVIASSYGAEFAFRASGRVVDGFEISEFSPAQNSGSTR